MKNYFSYLAQLFKTRCGYKYCYAKYLKNVRISEIFDVDIGNETDESGTESGDDNKVDEKKTRRRPNPTKTPQQKLGRYRGEGPNTGTMAVRVR